MFMYCLCAKVYIYQHGNYRRNVKYNTANFSQHLLISPRHSVRFAARENVVKYGIPEKFIAVVKSFYEGMLDRVLNEGEYSVTYLVTNGIKQGCMLAPTLFSVVFFDMLKTAFHDDRLHGRHMFNLRILQARTKVKEERVRDFLFTDYCPLNASSEYEMQWKMDKSLSACVAFGLANSTVPCPGMCLSTTSLMQDLPKQEQLSEGFVRICENDKDSVSK